jgi:hypothetical protein
VRNVDLFVDGVERISDVSGYGLPNTPGVIFGDTSVADAGHSEFQLVEWTACTGAKDGTSCDEVLVF